MNARKARAASDATTRNIPLARHEILYHPKSDATSTI